MKIQELISEFISYDETRPKIRTPWIKDDKVYATNGHILLSFPISHIEGFTVEMDDGSRINTSQCMEKEGFKKFDLSIFEKALESQSPSHTIEPAFEYCDCCFGEGEFETDEECACCDSVGMKMVRCQECSGSGSSKTPNPKKGEKRYKSTITKMCLPQRIVFADWKYIKIVNEAIKHFGGIWTVANKNNLTPIHFKQNEEGIDIVLMPMRPE